MSNSWWAAKLGGQPAGVPVAPYRQPQPLQQQARQAPVQAGTDLLDPEVGPTFSDALRRTDIRGPAAKLEGGLACPSCGNATSYTHYSGGGGGISGYRPTPHCFTCGYNGRFTQGDQANWTI